MTHLRVMFRVLNWFAMTYLNYVVVVIHGHLRFLAGKFQPDPKTYALVLGFYGMGGLVKTTI